MMNFADKYGNYIAACVILFIGLFVCYNFPTDSAYHPEADEGVYYQQAKTLTTFGVAGFNKIATIFIRTTSLHDFPHPLRLGTIVISALFINLHDAYKSLSFVSLASFLSLLIGTYLFVATYWTKTQALLTLLLLAISPIQLGMARTALMDSLALTSSAFAFFAFVRLLNYQTKKKKL